MRMGLAMMASKNPDFFGALGEAGIEGLKGAKESREAQAAAEKMYLSEVGDLLAARELSAAKAVTANQTLAENIRKTIDDLRDAAPPMDKDIDFDAWEKERQARIKRLEEQLNSLQGIGSGYGTYSGQPVQGTYNFTTTPPAR